MHGYWLDGERMGHVGLSPRGHKRVYSWGIDADPKLRGEEPTLRAAKRRVEVAFRRAYSWMLSREPQAPRVLMGDNRTSMLTWENARRKERFARHLHARRLMTRNQPRMRWHAGQTTAAACNIHPQFRGSQ